MEKSSQRIDRVIVLERHAGIREFLRDFLSRLVEVRTIDFALDCGSAREILCTSSRAVIIADPLLAPFGAFDVLESTRRSHPGFDGRLIAYSHDEPGRVVTQMCHRTSSVLVSGCAPVDGLSKAVRAAAGRSDFFQYVHPETKQPAETEDFAALTPRRLAVLLLISRGYSVKEASLELQITPKAVDSHLERLRSALRIRNRVDLAAFCRREGLLGTCDEAYSTHCTTCESRLTLGISQMIRAQSRQLRITCPECCDTWNCNPETVQKNQAGFDEA